MAELSKLATAFCAGLFVQTLTPHRIIHNLAVDILQHRFQRAHQDLGMRLLQLQDGAEKPVNDLLAAILGFGVLIIQDVITNDQIKMSSAPTIRHQCAANPATAGHFLPAPS
jgi:hypothetical protein